MDMERNRVHFEPPLLAFVGPLQPRFLVAKSIGKLSGIGSHQRLALRLFQEFRQLVCLRGGVEGSVGASRGLYSYRIFGMMGRVPSAALFAGGLFFRVASSCR